MYNNIFLSTKRSQRKNAEKIAKKEEAKESRLDTTLSHLMNATRNSGYIPPFE